MRKQRDSGREASPVLNRRQLLRWLWRLPVIAAVAGGVYGVFQAVRIQFGKLEPNESPTFAPLEPVAIAGLKAFDANWSEATFTAGNTPAIALRLPKRIPAGLTVDGAHYAAFSRVCTHQGCIVGLNTSPEAVALAANYRPENPALVCPCHLSVFLPLESGKAVSGPATLPLPRLQLQAQGDTLYAVGMETEG